MAFTHLHVHSHYSLLDGLPKVKALVKAAKERGFTSLALTDTGAMYGAIEFYKACVENGIKPIIGFETFVAPRRMEDNDPEYDKDAYSLILLAENYDGYRNLLLLCSEAQTRGLFNGHARLDKETLKKYAKNVIALSGTIRGEVPSLLVQGKDVEAKAAAFSYQDIFGPDNFYLELEDLPAISGQLEVNTKLASLGKDTNIPLVVTRDVHYINSEDAEAQDILCCIREGWKVNYDNREDYRQVDRSLCKEEEIIARFRHLPEAVENTGKIAERVNLAIELDKWHFAPIEIPKGKTADEVFREESFARLPDYYNPVTEEVTARLEYELDIIKKKGYAPYFLCVADYVRFAKSHGIVETTRGSAAGSIASYVMGITTVDPIRFKLPFERFLNPFRPSPPDIDTDFADDRRDEMIEYVTNKYGKDKVAQIITFGTMAARASVRDVGRALALGYGFCDQVAKLIPMGAQGFPMTITRALAEEPDLKKLYETNPDVKRLLDLAKKVEGCARHTSIHAAGVVISPTPLTDFAPVQYEVGGSRLTTQYEMKSVEAAGVLKNDFLGIRNLAILGNAVEIVEKTTGEKVDIYNLPLDDKTTFDMLARGETMGVFQLGGSGMTRWIKELKPTTIDDIMAMVALYRPGPMESIPEYIKRKYHPEVITYFDDRLKKILEASFGLLVYQDDVMLTAIELAGYDWMEADKFRKAMGKKIPEEMAQQKEKFYKGCLEKGKVKREIVDDMWKAIEPFAAYGFNKAHAASYGIVAYQTAYMKAHYPVQYMTSVLQAEAGDAEKVAAIVHEAKRMGIEVLPPDINESFRNFAMVSKPGDPGRIRFGLLGIKNVGDHICEVIYAERKQHGPYVTLENFLERVQDKDLNKKSIESLTQAGALDGFGRDRNVLLANIEQLILFTRSAREKNETGQDSLFAGTSISVANTLSLRDAPRATIDQKLVWEKTLLGVYVSSHPYAPFAAKLKNAAIPIADVETMPRDSWVIIGGVIEALKKKITKKGSVMMFATIQDMSGPIELLVFPKTYETTQTLWKEGMILCVVGKTPKDEGDNKIFVENVYDLKMADVEMLSRQLALSRPKDQPVKEHVAPDTVLLTTSKEVLTKNTPALKEVFLKFPGTIPVVIDVEGHRIRTGAVVTWSSDFEAELTALFGMGCAKFVFLP